MDAVERLTLEAAGAHSLLAVNHVHRYDLAAQVCAGLRVADVCCGSGYGSQILAETSESVLGIDNDATTIDAARANFADEKIEFEVEDALEFLLGDLSETLDALVMFECLEHVADPESVLDALRAQAEHGMRLLLSVPNSKVFREENPYHVTTYGYEEAHGAFASFDDCVVLYQFLAEGSLIRRADAGEVTGRLVATERGEAEYANHFIACVNFGDKLADLPDWAQMHLEAAPLHNRYVLGLERANVELHRTNTRLAHGLIGTADSAAASLLAKLDRTERELARVQKQLREKERAERQERELHAWIDGLHAQIADLKTMQATKAWRLVGRYYQLRDRLLRRG